MNYTEESLDKLHALAHWLGHPDNDLAILAEGNVSIANGSDKATYWLKASGSSLGTMRRDQFVLMNTARALSIMEYETLPDAEIKRLLFEAREPDQGDLYPSTEAALSTLR